MFRHHSLYPAIFFTFMFTISIVETIELTFELPDNEKQCFYEEIGQNNESTVEYQVVTGGNYDVDVQIFSPKNQRLYSEIRKQYGSHTWKADVSGPFKICFSNEFSTFSHKIVYMDWKIGDEKLVVPTNLAAMTMLETLSNSIHEKLKVVDDIQTHHRLRESGGRKSAEDLNERVLWWSLGQAIVMLVIFFAQVTVLKSFFSDRKNAGNRC